MQSTMMKSTFGVALTLAVAGTTLAGTLDPPGPPAPTMVTLQQIYDKIVAGAAVPKTGQAVCWNAAGTPITCTGTGQDGALQKGVSTSPRFTDLGNGAVRDNLTGLVWLKNAICFPAGIWTAALSDANTLASGACGLTDGSVAGDWRLPNLKELLSVIDYGHSSPALPPGHPFSVYNVNYWASTTLVPVPTNAWSVNIDNGYAPNYDKSYTFYVWPVRGGP